MRSRTRTHARAGRALALALALGLVLGGCGSGEETPESAEPGGTVSSETESAETGSTETGSAGTETTSEDPDLCALITAEEFESITGETAGPPSYDEPVGVLRGTCTWSAEAGFPMVMLSGYPADQRQATLDMVDSESVDGLGTEADWTDSAGLLVVVDGADWYLQVVATGDGAGYDRDRSVEFATLALGRL